VSISARNLHIGVGLNASVSSAPLFTLISNYL